MAVFLFTVVSPIRFHELSWSFSMQCHVVSLSNRFFEWLAALHTSPTKLIVSLLFLHIEGSGCHAALSFCFQAVQRVLQDMHLGVGPG